jgi:hypothetical protein
MTATRVADRRSSLILTINPSFRVVPPETRQTTVRAAGQHTNPCRCRLAAAHRSIERGTLRSFCANSGNGRRDLHTLSWPLPRPGRNHHAWAEKIIGANRRAADTQRFLETAAAQYLGDLLGPKDIRIYLAENPDMAEAVSSIATQLMFAKISDDTEPD